jgi:hypothetical protein
MSVYILRAGPVPWGDYGRVLVQGISRRLPRVDGVIQLERTGPFVPPIAFPSLGDVVVTGAFRSALESSGLSGLNFAPVTVATAVRVHWGTWSRAERLPPVLPPSGEPEDYVQLALHDPDCAREIGTLWEVEAPIWGIGSRTTVGFRKYGHNVAVRPGRPDFFRVEGLRFTFVSEGARQWLAAEAGDWVSFEAITHH